MSAKPMAVLVAYAAAIGGGLSADNLDLDLTVLLALVVQFGGIIWWGARMQTRQDNDREQARLMREEVRADRIATVAAIHHDVGAIDQRLTTIERHGSVEVQHLVKAVERLTEMSESMVRRLAASETICTIRHRESPEGA